MTVVVESVLQIAGQNIVPHVKYIAVVKGARWSGICDKKFPEEHRDYSLEEDLG
jgi:hypothetical protein